MASDDGATRAEEAEETGPRRSALLQARSRNTRRKLIRAALKLWEERGFERGPEETTAEEIARAAGVSKGTFYFHFAHKEDILAEMAWATVEDFLEEAGQFMRRGRPTEDLIDKLMVGLAKRVSSVPHAAVLRSVGRWTALRVVEPLPPTQKGFREVFADILHYGIDRGEVPPGTDVDDVSRLFQAAILEAMTYWAATSGSHAWLRTHLRRRAQVILRGAAATYGGAGGTKSTETDPSTGT